MASEDAFPTAEPFPPGLHVQPIPDVNDREHCGPGCDCSACENERAAAASRGGPEHISAVLRRVMLDVQQATDEHDVPGETREHLNAAWRELRKAVASMG